MLSSRSSLMIVNSCSRYYSTSLLSKKKILISGNDVVGLSLALFLKKKGISCDIIESSSGNNNNDTGIILTNKTLETFEKYTGTKQLIENIKSNSITLNGNGYFGRDGEGFGILNIVQYFKNPDKQPTILSIQESKLKELIISEMLGSGISNNNIKKNIKIKKIYEHDITNTPLITFSNSTIKNHYDLVIGSGNSFEQSDPIREYLIEKLTKSNDIKPNYYNQHLSTTYYFNTITNNNFSLIPPLLITQFQKQKKLVSFLLPNKKVALAGSFTRDFQITTESDKFNQLVSSEYKSFEDINAHNVISLSDNKNELILRKVENFQLNKFVYNSFGLIGDAADRLPQDNIFNTVVGIDDANNLVEIISSGNDVTTTTTSGDNSTAIPNMLIKYNESRKDRLKNYMKSIEKDQNLIFGSSPLVTIFGKSFLKYYYAGKRQYNRLKNLLN